MAFKHYITYFSLFTLHFSLTCCHSQRSAVEEQRIEVDSMKVHEEMVTIHLSDSLLQECIFQADYVSLTAPLLTLPGERAQQAGIDSAWSPTESGSLALGRLSATAEMQRGVRLVASGVTFASRKSKVKEEKAKVCIEDTTSVHIRDTTAVKNQVDRQAIYEPPDIRSILIVFGLFFISYLIFSRR